MTVLLIQLTGLVVLSQTTCLSFTLIGLLSDLGAGGASVTLLCLDRTISCHFPPPTFSQSPHAPFSTVLDSTVDAYFSLMPELPKPTSR